MRKLFIEARDIMILNQVSLRQARNVLAKMKEYYKKEKHHRITVNEYSAFHGVPPDEVTSVLC